MDADSTKPQPGFINTPETAPALPEVILHSTASKVPTNSISPKPAIIVETSGVPSTSGSGSNVPGVSVAGPALIAANPESYQAVIVIGGGIIIGHGAYIIATMDSNSSNSIIPLTGQ